MATHFSFKKLAALISLPILAIAVVVANNSLAPAGGERGESERGIASLSNPTTGISRDWEQELAEELARGQERIPASIRSRPSVAQELVFGPLEGKYSISYSEGRVAEIEFIDSSIGSDRPKYVGDPEAFIKEYKKAWAADFQEVRVVSQKGVGESVVHDLELLDGANSVKGTVKFITDKPGRLLHLKIQEI